MKTRIVPLTLAAGLLFTGCVKAEDPAAQTASQAPASCNLPEGKFGVQSVSHHSGTGEYELFVLDAPACFRQPYKQTQLRLARLDEKDKKDGARLQVNTAEDPTLYLPEDFKINLINEVVEGEKVVRQESSSWMPFVAGAAGAAVGGLLMNRMMNSGRPQYYMPPPHQPGSTVARGFGGSGDTYKGAVSTYQRNHNAPPPSEQRKGFFRKGTSAQSGSSSYAAGDQRGNTSKPAAPRKGFFRRRGR